MPIDLTQQAADMAIKWCSSHPGWRRICDVENIEALSKTWDELSKSQQAPWKRDFPSDPQGAWKEFGTAPSKYQYGFIGSYGQFFRSITDIPSGQGLMQVFKVN